MPPADPRRGLGRAGEDLAVKTLEARGYTIVGRNWRCPDGELDIIAHEGDCLVFVEVRTRRGGWPGAAEDSIGLTKQRRLLALADAYLQAERLPLDAAWRIDVVTVEMDRRGVLREVRVLQDAIGWR